MLTAIDNLVLAARLQMEKMAEKAKEGFKSFKEEEQGVSAIVATIILILIVVLLAVVFWNSISEFLADMWAKITGNADQIDNKQTSW